MNDLFKGRTLLIATNHKKEQVLAPILEEKLGVKCVVSNYFNTDQFGTFSGEVERKDDPKTTVKKKCLTAMSIENIDLAVASEGSFGSHPYSFFTSANEEWIVLIDLKNGLEIYAREISTETNFNGTKIESEMELLAFAKQVQFPSHALIIKDKKEGATFFAKGIVDEKVLIDTFHFYQSHYSQVYVETDMRAMHNPMRMKVIENTVHKLIDKINSCCPICSVPGFDVVKVIDGLPCQICHLPTNSTLSHIYACLKCGYSEEKKFPYSKEFEEPMYCNYCNP